MLWFSLLWSCTGDTTDPSGSNPTGSDTGPTDTDTGPTIPTGPITTTGDSGTTSACPEPALEIGNGAVSHEPLESGVAVTLVHGSQGGWHVDISGRITGLGDLVGISPSVVRLSDGIQLAGDQPPWFVQLLPLPDDPCSMEFAGLQALIDDLPLPAEYVDYQAFICSLDGEVLELSASVVDLNEATGTEPEPDAVATIQVVAQLDSFDAMYNCP